MVSMLLRNRDDTWQTPARARDFSFVPREEGGRPRAIARQRPPRLSKTRGSNRRIDPSPINPPTRDSFFAGADLSTAKGSGTADNPRSDGEHLTAVMKAMAGRWSRRCPSQRRGRVVVQAGASPQRKR